jgi:RHS repeat-associated protein
MRIPVTKTKRMTDSTGAVISTIVFDPWGGAMGSPWSQNSGQQRRRFTTYERDGNETDEAMFRRYNRWTARFDQPDPYDGSYNVADPQSFNRYSYVQNDPVNFVDPLGLDQDFGLGPPPPVPTLIPYGGTIVTNTWAPHPGGGGVGGGGLHPPLLDGPTVDPRGRGNEGPQNPAPVDLSHLGPPPPTCDEMLAAIFGGPGAVAATVIEPNTLQHPAAGINRFSHLAGNGTLHLYTNAQGAAATVGLYAPGGFVGRPVTGTVYQGRNDPNPGQVNYNYERFNYPGGLAISFVHVGNPGVNRSDRNAAGSIRVGSIAGPGGAGAGYNHTHVNVYQNGRRVDPRGVFCT